MGTGRQPTCNQPPPPSREGAGKLVSQPLSLLSFNLLPVPQWAESNSKSGQDILWKQSTHACLLGAQGRVEIGGKWTWEGEMGNAQHFLNEAPAVCLPRLALVLIHCCSWEIRRVVRADLVFALFPGPTPGPGLPWCALELGKRVAGYTSGVTAPAVQLCEQRMAQHTACTQKGLLGAQSWARLSEWMNC